MRKILWIAPNLNHYKARFLNRLNKSPDLEIVVLSGGELRDAGHLQHTEGNVFEQINVKAVKKNFHYKANVYLTILRLLLSRKFEIVLMPLEKKLVLLVFFLWLMKFFLNFQLVSYNHPTMRSGNNSKIFSELLLTKILFIFYDKIIFYTQKSLFWALKEKLLSSSKAYYANNTLDTELIWKNYSFSINTNAPKSLLFIGRLIPNKRLALLFSYYEELKKQLPDLRLIIIGDGPEAPFVDEISRKDENIIWKGAIIDEEKISQEMKKAHVVFIPGHSGLSIVHGFCYGKPFITSKVYKNHPPEIDYLKDNYNGLFLSGKLTPDCQRIVELLNDSEMYKSLCENAYYTAQGLTIQKWCNQIKFALHDKGN